MALSAADRRLLEALEEGLPLVPRPYQALGERVGLAEEEVIEALRGVNAAQKATVLTGYDQTDM